MKKYWMLLVMALVFGLVIIGCPSDPDPPPPHIDASFTLTNGIYEYTFDDDDPLMEFNKDYEVIIDVEELDDELGGCHFQGQLFYTTDSGTKYLLASSKDAQPQNIAVKGKKYRITLKAGDISDEDKASDKQTAGGYSIPAAGVTKVPDGATQTLKLFAKTPQWYNIGVAKDDQENNGNDYDNWDVNYYQPGIKIGIKGTITIREKPNLTYTDGATVSVNGGGGERDDTIGKGNIEGTEYAKLKSAPPDSLLRLSCTAEVVLSGGGGTNAQPGWGIAEFGTEMDKIRGQNQVVGVGIPRTITTAGSHSFTVDVLIEDIVDASDPDWTFLNVYNGGKVTAMKIRVPN